MEDVVWILGSVVVDGKVEDRRFYTGEVTVTQTRNHRFAQNCSCDCE